ncbi:reticulon-1a isoform X1 [Pangasianodon hypophthalmus]|uniref:reticulon-1a isoform X1 n=1 Tax=Pangasianodon hypophthalmus TaxID=310915 RepID=UPI0023073959|nr:reticulon-1a isoform X1 [Pangasianodon hypophthalmus]
MSGTGEPNGDERERPGPCFGRMREEEEEEEEEEKMKALKPTCPGDEARGGTGVAMETASSDSVSDLFLNASSERSDLYTSLLSSNSSSSNPFSTSVPLFSSEDDRSPLAPLGSDSGIGMTPGDPCDLHTQKNEPYNYMDMSDDLCDLSNRSSTGAKKQPIRSRMDDDDDDEDKDEKGSMDFKARMEKEVFDLGSYLEKNPENLAVKGDLGNTFPYVEDQSDDELLEDRPRLGSPVKITVTMDSCILATEQARGGLSERESVLSLGKEGVPTVTLSEPEDDSAASSVNHSPSHSPTGRESPSDILFQPVGMKCVNNSALYQATKGPVKASARFGTRDSGESGDSEIEPDSPRREKHSSVKDRPGNPFEPTVAGVEVNRGNKGRSEVSVNMKKESVQHGNPPLYSLLREEREAELDSDLLIESASEESPKREQVVKCTLKPSSPPSSPPPVSSAVSPPLKVKEQEVKEEKKEKPSAAPREESNTQPQQQEDKVFTKAKPEVMVSFEQRPLEDGGSKSTVMSTEAKKDPKEAELLLFLHNFNKQKVVDLLHWRDMRQTAVLFSSVLLLLFSLTQFSVVSVTAYLALAALSTTISFRVYKSVLQAVQKTDDGHPFKAYLEKEISLSPEQISKYVEKVQLYVNHTLKELRRLFLVQDLVDSLKFAVLMWLLTYVGALFNGLTLLILAVVCVFTVPLVYEKYQKQIDQYLGLVRTQVNSVMTKLREKVPGAKRKDE